jgi:hypothetical protein
MSRSFIGRINFLSGFANVFLKLSIHFLEMVVVVPRYRFPWNLMSYVLRSRRQDAPATEAGLFLGVAKAVNPTPTNHNIPGLWLHLGS